MFTLSQSNNTQDEIMRWSGNSFSVSSCT